MAEKSRQNASRIARQKMKTGCERHGERESERKREDRATKLGRKRQSDATNLNSKTWCGRFITGGPGLRLHWKDKKKAHACRSGRDQTVSSFRSCSTVSQIFRSRNWHFQTPAGPTAIAFLKRRCPTGKEGAS